jgi:hypothetical protein
MQDRLHPLFVGLIRAAKERSKKKQEMSEKEEGNARGRDAPGV